jgi:hypothetical protein
VLDYLLQYGLFLAEVTTVVIAIGVVMMRSATQAIM